MKKLLLFLSLAPLLAFAEDVVPTESWLLQVLTFVSTMKGLSTIAIAAGVAQLCMVFFKTPLANFAGKYKLLAVSLLTVVGLVLASLATGVSLSTALGQAPVLAAVQVAVNQVWKHLFEDSQPVPA